ncbi:MAG TPA: phosphate ABC transporter substrate-binding protein [Lachnospiraceae bacterium]
MKRYLAGLALAGSVLLTAVGCGSNGGAKEESDSKETKAEEIKEEAGFSGNISTNGSTSMEKVIGVLSEQFQTTYPNVTITYDATGSGTGIEAVINKTTDIGLASRALKDEEKEKGLVETTVALDGIAIIVNENNPIEDLSVEDIKKIYTGELSNWSTVKGGKDGDISCIGREAGSGTRDGFESITDTKDACKLSQELTSTGAVIESVKNSEQAIGYASFASVENQEGIKVVTVNGVECNAKNIADGTYLVQRPFNLVTAKDAALSEQAQGFFDFMLSEDAKELIEAAGAVYTGK